MYPCDIGGHEFAKSKINPDEEICVHCLICRPIKDAADDQKAGGTLHDEIKFEFTDEQREQFHKLLEVIEKAQAVFDALVEIAKMAMDVLRKIAEQLGRFFMKMQLLEWRIPMRLADLISQKMSSYWVIKFGFNWFERKMAMIE